MTGSELGNIAMKITSVIIVMYVASMAAEQTEQGEAEYIFGEDVESQRDAKVFPFVAVVRLPDEMCSSSGSRGICQTQKQCRRRGGSVISGSTCGNGYGVCCTFTKSCSNNGNALVLSSSGTHITNSSESPSRCRVDLRRPSADFCQVRLDFVVFTLSQPNGIGSCENDFMTINGADNPRNFITCGNNTGQHLILHYGTSDVITASINLYNADSKYDIIATYVRCSYSDVPRKGKSLKQNAKLTSGSSGNSEDDSRAVEQAPPGCTQYFTGSVGEVRSFNYLKAAASANQSQINGQRYAVCVQAPSGSNMIRWSPCSDAGSFCISGKSGETGSKFGTNCTTDYIEIPGSENGRYCGCGVPPLITSVMQPFAMYVRFDDYEAPGANLPVNPATGCPFGFTCIDNIGGDVVDRPCDPSLGDVCAGNDFYNDLLDIGNNGFCLRYMIT